MVVQVGEVLCKLEDPSQPWDHSFVVDDLDELVGQESVGKGQHPQLVRFLCQDAEFVSITKFCVGSQNRQEDVEEGQHLLNMLDVQLKPLVELFLELD